MARAGRLLAPQRQSGVTTSPSQFGPWEYIDKCTKIEKNNYLTPYEWAREMAAGRGGGGALGRVPRAACAGGSGAERFAPAD
ncbi:hypothetical protein EVAR_83608_1 [Eumeta japonica]|uniref:Uncharacterized protein n=1 Tax=Eumeta variegata TaxID=151549 RepID=A0A4C1UPJ1_EUMVA|nr:hypothetical protein EVAR_83608_1 [Eumeta japonica]